jgi:hypothetical protein
MKEVTMGARGLLRGVVVGLFICAGLIGLMETDAFAVAGRVVDSSAATSLAGAEVKFELKDGDSVTTTVNQDATFNAPQKVSKDTVDKCFRKKVNATTGKTEWVEIDCGWFFFGGGMAAAGGGGVTGGLMGGVLGNGGLEFIISGGGVTAFGGGNDGRSASSVSSSSTPGQSLVGSSLNLQLRAFPFTLHGIKLGAFAEFDQFFGANGTTGIAVFHALGPNPQEIDTQTTRRLKRAYAFGLTQVIPIGNGFSVDFLQGIAFLQQTIEGQSNEAKGGGTLVSASSSTTNIVPKLGASLEYQFPGSSISIRLASEFIYLPSLGTNAFSTFLNRPYSFSTDSTWTANAMLGLVIPLNAIVSQFSPLY